jgi:uncharacterized membrane protein
MKLTKFYKDKVSNNTMKRKTIFLLIPSILIAIILTAAALNHFTISLSPSLEISCECQHTIPEHYYLIFGIVLILLSIPITYYYISEKMEKKLNEHVESFSRIVNKSQNKNNLSYSKKILKFLSPIEQKIINLILDEKEILQSQLSKSGHMTKLQAHRAVKNLEERKIVKTEHYGKTKKITLKKEFKKLL